MWPPSSPLNVVCLQVAEWLLRPGRYAKSTLRDLHMEFAPHMRVQLPFMPRDLLQACCTALVSLAAVGPMRDCLCRQGMLQVH